MTCASMSYCMRSLYLRRGPVNFSSERMGTFVIKINLKLLLLLLLEFKVRINKVYRFI